MTRFDISQRKATSALEVIIAIALLVMAATLVGRFVSQVKQGLRDRELSARLEWELLNCRERIGSWPTDQITVEKIQRIPISEALASQVTDAHLSAAVRPVDSPLAALQVTLAIECSLRGQASQPSLLTFWVPSESENKL